MISAISSRASAAFAACKQLPRFMKVALTICLLFTANVNAVQWNSYADARAYYSGGPCGEIHSLMTPSIQCTRENIPFSECYDQMPHEKVRGDLYVFTRHFSDQGLDPVSIVEVGKRTCFYTALTPDSGVTKICYSKALETHTIERVPGMSLHKAHEGLEPGQSVVHVGMEMRIYPEEACGHFHKAQLPSQLTKEDICLYTSLHEGGTVSEICFRPERPELLTLKEAPSDIKLEHSAPDTPAALLVKRKELPPPKKGISLMQALSCWWNEKTTCVAD